MKTFLAIIGAIALGTLLVVLVFGLDMQVCINRAGGPLCGVEQRR